MSYVLCIMQSGSQPGELIVWCVFNAFVLYIQTSTRNQTDNLYKPNKWQNVYSRVNVLPLNVSLRLL